MNVPEFTALKHRGQKIALLTAYDYPMAKLVDAAGVDAILVGDSLGMVVQGKENTLSVTLDEMIYHTGMVRRAAENALVILDMPFPCGHTGWRSTLKNAARALKETGCHGVKIEGGASHKDVIRHLTDAGIPVMSHIGVLPQLIQKLGKYTLQRQRDELMSDALAVQEAGAFTVVLECVLPEIALEITQTLDIPTIGIGSGAHCDGQVLVLHDLLGMTPGRIPKHVKQYAHLADIITHAVKQYCADVRGEKKE